MADPIQSKLAPGATTQNPEDIAAALKRLQDLTHASGDGQGFEQPLSFVGGKDEEPSVSVSAEELKPATEAKPEIKGTRIDLPEARPGGAPAWVVLPVGIKFPVGRHAYFLRFPAEWTFTPKKGMPDSEGKLWRQAIIWPMSMGDKKFALGRAMGDGMRASDEMVKSTLRAIDGQLVDLADNAVDTWYDEVGEKVRGLLMRVWSQMHLLKPAEIDFFLEQCVEVRSAG